MNTYWQRFPRDFANEYEIGVATTAASGEQYKDEGYTRIARDTALRDMSWRGNAATQAYVSVTIDGDLQQDRLMLARGLRHGEG